MFRDQHFAHNRPLWKPPLKPLSTPDDPRLQLDAKHGEGMVWPRESSWRPVESHIAHVNMIKNTKF